MSNDSRKNNGSWLFICSNCRYQFGLASLVQLLLHLSCLCKLKKTKGGNMQKQLLLQVRKQALTPIATSSGCQDTYLFNCLLILVAKRSMSGIPNFSTILFYFILLIYLFIYSFLKKSRIEFPLCFLSASILIAAGVCAAETHNLFLVQKSHILQKILL